MELLEASGPDQGSESHAVTACRGTVRSAGLNPETSSLCMALAVQSRTFLMNLSLGAVSKVKRTPQGCRSSSPWGLVTVASSLTEW